MRRIESPVTAQTQAEWPYGYSETCYYPVLFHEHGGQITFSPPYRTREDALADPFANEVRRVVNAHNPLVEALHRVIAVWDSRLLHDEADWNCLFGAAIRNAREAIKLTKGKTA